MADKIFALEFEKHKPKLGQNYLILGTDAYLIDKVLDRIKKTLAEKHEIDISIVYGDEVKSGELGEYLDTFTIFSSSKLIIIKNAEAFRKKELEVVASYFDSPSEIQSVAIVTEKINKTFNSWKQIDSGCTTVICNPPRFANEIRNWLVEELRRRGKTMSPQAINEFTNRIEMDYATAANELNKIDLLVGERTQIAATDLSSLGGSRAGTQIDFYRAMGKKKLNSAIEAVDLMLDADWEPLQILFAVNRFFITLWKIQLLRQRHITDSEISSRYMTDIFSNQRREYLDFAKNFPIKVLEKIIAQIMDTDHKLKSSSIDKRILLDLSIIRILGQK
jgi:DNA polymerase III subunit delta